MIFHPLKSLAAILIFICAAIPGIARADDKPDWLEPMKALHAQFDGDPGYVAQLGDSITMSLAFWAPLGWDEPGQYLPSDGLPKSPAGKQWRSALKGFRDKGRGHGNETGWTIASLAAVTKSVLDHEKPEIAIIMIGTNDVATDRVSRGYREHLDAIIGACLQHHCVPILNTIPPRHGSDKAVEQVNEMIRDAAHRHHVVLVDYYAEVLARRPGKTWEGSLVGKDGVHPNNENNKPNVYTTENMTVNGYALRNYLDFLAVREVYFRVLHPING